MKRVLLASLLTVLIRTQGPLGAVEPEAAPVVLPASPPGYYVLVEPGPYSEPVLQTQDWLVDSEARVLDVALGLRDWLSSGCSMVRVAGLNGTPPVLSELVWHGQGSSVLELWADAVWLDRWVMVAELGVGSAGAGCLHDRDFNDDQSLAFESRHPTRTDDLFYFNLDFGYRFVNWCWGPGRFTLDALLGYQHWQERYVAYGGRDVYPGSQWYPRGPVISNRFAWDSLRLGASARLERGRWGVQGRLYLIPVTSFENVDVHFLRFDLQRDPSFVDHASGGFGVMGDLIFHVRLWRGLELEAGYRAWDISAGSGHSVTRTPSGDLVSPFGSAGTFRHGLLLGLQYRF